MGPPYFFLIKNVLLLMSYTNENTSQNVLDVVNTEITDNRTFIATNAYIKKISNQLTFTMRN